ncbi:MAG: hypothetical protein K6G07_04180 [Lachnospiraceae bacterium]|nr:hypothetical protein [Lachnospiraceae bacterium]
MTKRIKAYMAYMDAMLTENTSGLSYEELCVQHEKQLAFFMHERLVHEFVMLTFAILAFAVFFLMYVAFHPELVLLFLALMVLLVPYIMHYFLLENSCQYMYRQYDELQKKIHPGAFLPDDNEAVINAHKKA